LARIFLGILYVNILFQFYEQKSCFIQGVSEEKDSIPFVFRYDALALNELVAHLIFTRFMSVECAGNRARPR
jgi:hypothetical protein